MRNALTRLSLGPLLLVQGHWTRWRTPRLPEAPGPRSGIAGHGPKLRLLVLGDSAAAGVGAPHQDQALAGRLVAELGLRHRVEWELVAVSGATTRSTLDRLTRRDPSRFDVAVTSLGVNDVVAGTELDAWIADQRRLRELLRSAYGVSRMVISGLPPVSGFPALPQPLRWYLGRRARDLDAALAEDLREEEGTVFLSLQFARDARLMASDGFHPGPEVYRVWAIAIAQALGGELEGS